MGKGSGFSFGGFGGGIGAAVVAACMAACGGASASPSMNSSVNPTNPSAAFGQASNTPVAPKAPSSSRTRTVQPTRDL